MVSITVKSGYSVARESGTTVNANKNPTIKAGSKIRSTAQTEKDINKSGSSGSPVPPVSPAPPGSPQDQFRDFYNVNAPSVSEISQEIKREEVRSQKLQTAGKMIGSQETVKPSSSQIALNEAKKAGAKYDNAVYRVTDPFFNQPDIVKKASSIVEKGTVGVISPSTSLRVVGGAAESILYTPTALPKMAIGLVKDPAGTVKATLQGTYETFKTDPARASGQVAGMFIAGKAAGKAMGSKPKVIETPAQAEILTGYTVIKDAKGTNVKLKTEHVSLNDIAKPEIEVFNSIKYAPERTIPSRYSHTSVKDGITTSESGSMNIKVYKPVKVTARNTLTGEEVITSDYSKTFKADIETPRSSNMQKTRTIEQFESIKKADPIPRYEQKIYPQELLDNKGTNYDYMKGKFINVVEKPNKATSGTGKYIDQEIDLTRIKNGQMELDTQKWKMNPLNDYSMKKTTIEDIKGEGYINGFIGTKGKSKLDISPDPLTATRTPGSTQTYKRVNLNEILKNDVEAYKHISRDNPILKPEPTLKTSNEISGKQILNIKEGSKQIIKGKTNTKAGILTGQGVGLSVAYTPSQIPGQRAEPMIKPMVNIAPDMSYKIWITPTQKQTVTPLQKPKVSQTQRTTVTQIQDLTTTPGSPRVRALRTTWGTPSLPPIPPMLSQNKQRSKAGSNQDKTTWDYGRLQNKYKSPLDTKFKGF